jgi:hypothetical protein
MRTPNVIVADWPGASVPTVAEIVPATPGSGALTEPCDVPAGTAAEYTVLAGVASFTTTFVTEVVPTFVTTIS